MSYIDNYKEWLFSDELDQHEKARLASLTEMEKEEMFYGPLAFGTAGMRGILDVGTNRMNVHTVKIPPALPDHVLLGAPHLVVGEDGVLGGLTESGLPLVKILGAGEDHAEDGGVGPRQLFGSHRRALLP